MSEPETPSETPEEIPEEVRQEVLGQIAEYKAAKKAYKAARAACDQRSEEIRAELKRQGGRVSRLEDRLHVIREEFSANPTVANALAARAAAWDLETENAALKKLREEEKLLTSHRHAHPLAKERATRGRALYAARDALLNPPKPKPLAPSATSSTSPRGTIPDMSDDFPEDILTERLQEIQKEIRTISKTLQRHKWVREATALQTKAQEIRISLSATSSLTWSSSTRTAGCPSRPSRMPSRRSCRTPPGWRVIPSVPRAGRRRMRSSSRSTVSTALRGAWTSRS